MPCLIIMANFGVRCIYWTNVIIRSNSRKQICWTQVAKLAGVGLANYFKTYNAIMYPHQNCNILA